jgi:hypothetical protein
MLDGLSNVIQDETIIPRDGTVEICVIQFATGAQVEIAPTVVTAANYATLATQVAAISQLGGNTNIGDAINTCVASMATSASYDDASVWKVINIATDGQPTVGSPSPEQHAQNAVTAATTLPGKIDEIDAECIGNNADPPWMAAQIVYPDGPGGVSGPIVPPASYPPRPPDPNFLGFVRICADYTEYEDAIRTKMQLILKGFLSITPESAINVVNTEHCVTATLIDGNLNPVVGAIITFTVTGVNPTTAPLPTVVTDASGQAKWCYTGTNLGVDTITATWDDTAVSGQLLVSEPAIKEWVPPQQVEVGGDIFPSNKIALLAPWMLLAAAIIAGTAIAFKRGLIKS